MSYLRAVVQLVYQGAWRAILLWRLRRQGIDPDTIPEIQELRRRRDAGEPLEPDEPPQSHPP
ncbi:MAG TPA: hypothetical protein VFV87_21395 [Pirellulaceae bacterium]|nr:hypothetical protein [Pirellulaceae bacterium]